MPGLAHNLIHINCAERRRAMERRRGDKTRLDLPYFYAWKNYPFKSSAWTGVARLANNLIHNLCAERAALVLLVSSVIAAPAKPPDTLAMLDIYAGELSSCESST